MAAIFGSSGIHGSHPSALHCSGEPPSKLETGMSRKIGQGQKPKGHTNQKSQNMDSEKHTKTEKNIKTKTKVEKTNRRKAAPSKLETGMSRKIGQGQKQRDTRTTNHKKGQTETHKNKNKDGETHKDKNKGREDKIDMTLW